MENKVIYVTVYGHIIEDLSKFCKFEEGDIIEHKKIHQTLSSLFFYWESKKDLAVGYMVMKKVKLCLGDSSIKNVVPKQQEIVYKAPPRKKNIGIQTTLDF